MCGEHDFHMDDMRYVQGSSPHVRGAPCAQQRCFSFSGIIPACAGSTVHGIAHLIPIGDHPRMCGEHNCILRMNAYYTGSSPHVRGAPDRGECESR